MCLPIVGALLGAVGSMITSNEQQKNAERQAAARNQKMELTLSRNDPIADQSRKALDARLAKSTPDAVTADQTAEQNKRTAQVEQAVTPVAQSTDNAPLTGSAPAVVQSALAKKMQDVFAQGKARAQAAGALGSYGDSWLNQGFANADVNRQQSIDNNFLQGNLQILPAQQDIAETRAYKPISPIGGILSGLGSMFGGMGG